MKGRKVALFVTKIKFILNFSSIFCVIGFFFVSLHAEMCKVNMRLKKLSLKNNKTGWNVQDIEFGSLTLFVGASGVGKTQILRALVRLSQVALGRSYNGMEWEVSFTQGGHSYQWSGAFEAADIEEDMYISKEILYDILWEKVSVDEQMILDRQGDQIIYKNQQTLKLDRQKSAVNILRQEEDVEPIFSAFGRLYQLDTNSRSINLSPVMQNQSKALSLSEIRHLYPRLSAIDKLFLMRKNNLPEFFDVCDDFCKIFTSIERIDFTTGRYFDERTYPILQIKERGSDAWILQSEISAGMYRTLSMLVALYLAEDGDVILVDEFENGLGVNCINELAEMFINPESNVQIIMTSHHPYIINTIPYQSWKVVTRNGSTVQIRTADELNIGAHSKHDAFMQLIQTSAYQKGSL